MQMILGMRIKQLRQEKGLTQAQFGTCFRLAESTISLYESGKRSPGYNILCKFALFFDVSIDYLLGYTNDRNPASLRETGPGLDTDPKADPRPVKLPVYKNVRFGPGGPVYEKDAAQEWASCDNNQEGHYYWLRVKNDYLTGDGILPDDLVLIREQPGVEYGEIGLVVVDGHPAAIHRIFKKESSIVLHSSNAAYPPRIFTGKNLSSIRIVGKAIELKRKL